MLQWGLAIFVALTVNVALFLAMQQLLVKTEKPPVLEKKIMRIAAVTPPLESPQPEIIPPIETTLSPSVIPNTVTPPPFALTTPPPPKMEIPSITPSIEIPLDIVGSAYLGQVRRTQKKQIQRKKDQPVERKQETIVKKTINPPKKKIDLSSQSLNKALATAEKQQRKKPLAKVHDAKQFRSMVNATPSYPRRAQKRGITGHIKVEFTILPSGAIKDIVIISGENIRYFEKAVLQALKKSRYRPLQSSVRAKRTYHFRLEH